MVRRLMPRLARSRGMSARSRTAAAGAREGVRRGPQLLAWALVLSVFCGLAFLSGQADGFGSQPQAPSSPAVAADSSESAVADGGGLVLAADVPGDPTIPPSEFPTINPSQPGCSKYEEVRDSLPLYRWDDLSLFGVDNAHVFKTQLFNTIVSSLMFMGAGMAWRIIGILMSVGYGFDMICTAAGPVNFVSQSMSLYASWFLIPSWLFVLAAVARRWTSGRSGGSASALRLLVVFLVATGMIFFIGDQAGKNEDSPTGPYTLPWMATTVQKWVGTIGSFEDLQKLGRDNRNKYANPLFYDDHPDGGAGKVTCAALDEALYKQYREDNEDTSMNKGVETMIQLSKMWEITLGRSWQVAQFGTGTRENPSAAHASCRVLEAHSDVGLQKKLEAYDRSTGNASKTTQGMLRATHIDPRGNEQSIMIAWGACKGRPKADSDGNYSDGIIPQWKDSAVKDTKKACDTLYSDSTKKPESDTMFERAARHLTHHRTGVNVFYFNGDRELHENLGDCVATNEECRVSWEFVSAWLGKNQAQRFTQSLMSLIVSGVFLFALGPVALGQAVSSIALAGLVMILPVTLLLLALNLHQGKRLIKLTGGAALGNLYFTFAITTLTMFIDTTTGAVNAVVGTNSPNFFEQVAQGMAPLIALFLYRKLSRILGTGDLSTTTGALGFAGAMMLRAGGDRDAAQRMSRSLGRLGVGRMRLSALDERSLQRRMFNNRATRALARATGRGIKAAARPVGRVIKRGAHKVGQGTKRAVQPLTDWTKKRADAARANYLRGTQALRRMAASTALGQRAKAALSSTAALSLMAFTAGGAVLGGGKVGLQGLSRWWDVQNGDAGGTLKRAAAAGFPMAKNTHSAVQQAQSFIHNITRIHDKQKQHILQAQHARDALDLTRARQWGANQKSGLNMDFNGFSNDYDKALGLADIVDVTGMRPDQVLLGDTGGSLPVPVIADKRGRRHFPSGTTIEQASHPMHYVDPDTLKRRVINGKLESDDQLIARLIAQMDARGCVTGKGEYINVFQANGFDTDDPGMRKRIAAYIAGGRDDELSKIVITAQGSETAAVKEAYNWVRDSRPTPTQSRQRNIEVVTDMMDSMQRDIGNFSNISIEMPDKTFGSAEKIHLQLDQLLESMEMKATEIKNLYDARSNKAIKNDFFRQELRRLFDEHQDKCQDLDRLSAWLLDAVDRSSAMRGEYELWTKLANPDTVMDAEELSQATEELKADFQQQQQRWRETIDRLVGAVTRKPGDSSDANTLFRAIYDLKKEIDGRVDSERDENEEVIKTLKDIQKRIEEADRLTSVDPRRSSNNPVNVSDLLNGQHLDQD